MLRDVSRTAWPGVVRGGISLRRDMQPGHAAPLESSSLRRWLNRAREWQTHEMRMPKTGVIAIKGNQPRSVRQRNQTYSGERGDHGKRGPVNPGGGWALGVENSDDSLSCLLHSSPHGLHQGQASTQETLFRYRYQTLCIGPGVRGTGQHKIVAGHFPLQRQPTSDPPERWMKKKSALMIS